MNKSEILRYMRVSSATQDKEILALVDKAIKKIESTVCPKSLYRIFDCTVDENSLNIEGYSFKSKRLAENLKGCNRVVIFGATLGVDCDRIINSALATDTAFAMALQATAAEKIEQVCNDLENSIQREHSVNLRKRYSPGYYDLNIIEQKKIFEILELTKRIGLSLTDTCEMVPSKSVTAFIGID